jgi:hypothetical protein
MSAGCSNQAAGILLFPARVSFILVQTGKFIKTVACLEEF